MIVQREIGADVALAAAAAFIAVPNPEANMSLQAPIKKVVAEFFIDGEASVTAAGERLDLDIFIQKDGDATGTFLSALLAKYELGLAAKADGLWGVEAEGGGEVQAISRRKSIELPEGTYKCELRYKTTAGAAVLAGAVHDFEWGVKFTRSVALLTQANVPQNHVQV